jgi:phage-related holin
MKKRNINRIKIDIIIFQEALARNKPYEIVWEYIILLEDYSKMGIEVPNWIRVKAASALNQLEDMWKNMEALKKLLK